MQSKNPIAPRRYTIFVSSSPAAELSLSAAENDEQSHVIV